MRLRLLPVLALLAACGGSDGGTAVDYVIVRAPNGGSDQIGSPGNALAQPLRAKVTNGAGTAQPGVTVQWSTLDGSITASSVTNDSGIASATWTLGDATSAKTTVATASVAGSSISTSYIAFIVPSGSAIVQVTNDAFVPDVSSILPGGRVTWVWKSDAVNHNVEPVTPPGPPSSSGAPRNGPFVFEQTFVGEGSYPYRCAAHPGMTGTVNVSVGTP
jgi:plastocyanin